ncbi:hypothetical protein KDN32_05445 [Nocardioides sp. J2M5]|uniref:hypothetical protein n=1 Tax=Nocardioides palaemonis TaxID=2829810 RepID=UPI001BA5A3AE|nr:hypothetical protein [Nocardioides palaemonis]MBS2937181.1 hypothetical protein [Nocardioides palaemonis]
MTRHLGRTLLPALLSATVLLGAPAHAERVVTEDLSGDAEAWVAEQEFQFVPAPQEASVDVVRTVASFGERRLRVRVHFRDLEVRARHSVSLLVRTPRSSFLAAAERRSARATTTRFQRRGIGPAPCGGLRADHDGRADVVTVSVPARCIGDPRWVRLGATVTATPRTDPDNPSTVFYFADDAHGDTFDDEALALGPRIHRG